MPLLLLLSIAQIAAVPVVSEHYGVRLHWSRLRFHYTSASKANTYVNLEQKAWHTGIAHLQAAVFSLYQQQQLAAAHAALAIEQTARNLRLQQTIFYPQHQAQVEVEGMLTHLFPQENFQLNTKIHPQTTTRNSGLILRVSQPFAPQAVYEVHSQQQQQLFSSKDVNASAFAKNLMGRFFAKATARELQRYVGKNPHTLRVRATTNKTLEVQTAAWQNFIEGNEGLLRNSRIALVLTNYEKQN